MLRTVDERSTPAFFMHSEEAQWSAYATSQLGSRQGGGALDVKEAAMAEPALMAELDALYSRLRDAASNSIGSDPASELVGEMERVAATTLHAALLECLSAAGVEEESSHIWSDAPTAATLVVPALMPETQPEASEWGQLVVEPPSLNGSRPKSLMRRAVTARWNGRSRRLPAPATTRTKRQPSSCACCKERTTACSLASRTRSILHASSATSMSLP